MKFKCDLCGMIRDKSPSLVKNSNHNFCDIGCYNDWKKFNRVILSNSDLNLLDFIKGILKDLGIGSKIYLSTKKGVKTNLGIANYCVYQLHISRRENLQRYFGSIGFSIGRKHDKLEKTIDSYVDIRGGK